MSQPVGSAHRHNIDHLETYSALVSASKLALSAWRNEEADTAQRLHATNVLEFVLATIEPDRLPTDVQQFRAVKGA